MSALYFCEIWMITVAIFQRRPDRNLNLLNKKWFLECPTDDLTESLEIENCKEAFH